MLGDEGRVGIVTRGTGAAVASVPQEAPAADGAPGGRRPVGSGPGPAVSGLSLRGPAGFRTGRPGSVVVRARVADADHREVRTVQAGVLQAAAQAHPVVVAQCGPDDTCEETVAEFAEAGVVQR